MDIGPVQLLVIGFDDPELQGGVLAELTRLTDMDLVRVLDVLVLERDAEGSITVAELTGLPIDEMEHLGALAGALTDVDEDGHVGPELGLPERGIARLLDDLDLFDMLDEIPKGSAAAVALVEHRWAASLRRAIVGAGGVPLVDMWVQPLDLVAVSALAAAG